MKNSENLQMSGEMLGGFVRCAQNSPDCDLMAWAIANQDLARVIKTSDAPNDNTNQIMDNVAKINEKTKKICYNCVEQQR